MITLNLANALSSKIEYEIFYFPDGQQDILIKSKAYMLNKVTIVSRFNSFKDLELIICATKALRRLGVREINLDIPYLLGARSDRHFQEGGNSYLVDVIAPIINAQRYNKVTSIDVHSDVAQACIDNFVSVPNHFVVQTALYSFGAKDPEDYIIVAPDAGALKKVYDLMTYLNKNMTSISRMVIGTKHRDVVTGKISHTSVDIPKEYLRSTQMNKYVIVDDICDGGRTFIELAKAIKKKMKDEDVFAEIYLVVTHGIFSAGYEELGKHFDGIYCTNSVKNIGDLHSNDLLKTKVKQLYVI